jgi:hypothetical protein
MFATTMWLRTTIPSTRTTFSRGLGREDLFAVYRVLKPSSGDARYSPKTPSRPGLESRCYRIVRLARRMLLAPSAHRKSACGYAGQRQPLHLQASANAARAELATPKPGSQAYTNLSVPRYGSGIRPDDRAPKMIPKALAEIERAIEAGLAVAREDGLPIPESRYRAPAGGRVRASISRCLS